MPFARPTLPVLIDRAETDVEANLPGADARLRRSNLNVLARVNAGAAHGLYGFLAWIARQILPDTADPEFLELHARTWLPKGRLVATYARGGVDFTGVDGTPIPAGTIVKRTDGTAYAVEAEVAITGGKAHARVIAEAAGRAANAPELTALRLDSPIIGVTAQAFADVEGLTGGADAETDAALLTRLLNRIQKPPQGGNAADYVTWALEATPAVTRAWCYPLEQGEGTVVVRFVCDNDPAVIPGPAVVAAVQAYLDLVRPVTAHVFALAPVPLPITFRLSIQPSTVETRAAVEANLRDLLIREARPQGRLIEGVPYIDGKILLTHVTSAIALAQGVFDYTLFSPEANIRPGIGEMAVFGGIEWV